MLTKPDIVVIGGGIIGTSSAYELAKKGAQVTVIEKNKVGHGCSYGNAGWITPCFALPLPMPGLFLQSLKWLSNPNSPLYIKPSLNPLLLKWLFLFTKSMTAAKAQRATESLVALSQKSLELYKKLDFEFPHEIDFQQKGLLMVSQTDSGMKSILTELDFVNKYGVPGSALSSKEIQHLEPAIIGPVLGGVYFPAEAHAEPLAVVKTLRRAAEKLGVKFVENCEVLSFEQSEKQITKIITNTGEIRPDFVVLATGSWTMELAKKINSQAPILGGKGYSMIYPKLIKQPSHPIMFLERKIAITPRNNSLRIAGTLELVNQDFSMTKRRVENIKKGARLILDLPENIQPEETWVGLRPCTPDGLPMIGFSKQIHNLVYAAGHQMLGLQSGLGTGHLVARVLFGNNLTEQEKVFDPNRFL